MTRPLLLLAGAACALACGNSTKIPLGSLDGGAGPSPDRGDAARPPADAPRSNDSSPLPPMPGPSVQVRRARPAAVPVPGPVFPDAGGGVPVPGPVFPDAGASAPIGGTAAAG